ncbi:hypothetical protein FRB99_006398 [Tulasnella sp. 403]|nr:hypothetical protein FRB99_006398 [Tulasnella sp. 403]
MSYPVAPPSYQGTSSRPHDQAAEPLLGQSSRSGGGIFNQPGAGELPDDFKYGVSVYESAPEIRNAFIRKVLWALWTAMIGSFVSLGFLWWKRHSHPLNLALLSLFTFFEAFTVGLIIGFYDQVIVLQALLITLGVFLGLTLFTYQSKYDFSGMGPFLFAGLLVLVMAGFVGIFIPFSKTMDLIYAIGGAIIFSGYIVYDTFIITKKLSPDEAIIAAISLYLDLLNLFLSILRILNNVEER